jgi:MFS family permease
VSDRSKGERASLAYAWYVVVVLMLCYTLSFIDRQILAFLVGPIKRDLHVSDTQIGLLLGLYFAVFYTVLGIPLGWMADRMNRRNIIVVGVVSWSLMTALGSVARNFGTLALARMGVGVGEATLAPAASSLITDYFPKEKLSTALSVYAVGILLGSGLAQIVGGAVSGAVATEPPMDLPLIGTVAAWQVTFLIVGLPGILVAALAMTIREPARRGLIKTEEGVAARLRLGQIISQLGTRWQSLVGVALAMACQGMGNYAFNFWGPEFFIRTHGWNRAQIGLTLGLITLTAGCAGLVSGGVMADRWLKQGRLDASLRVGLIGMIGGGFTLVPAMLVSDASLTVMLLIPALFFLGLPLGSTYASLQLIVPNQVRAIVAAIMIFILNLGGLGLGPLLPGLFNDFFFKSEAMIGRSIALTVGVAFTVGAIIFALTCAPYRRHYAENNLAAEGERR